MKSVFMIRIKGGHYSNVFYETKQQANAVLRRDVHPEYRIDYEVVEIKNYNQKVSVN